jgi:hypothetical protein
MRRNAPDVCSGARKKDLATRWAYWPGMLTVTVAFARPTPTATVPRRIQLAVSSPVSCKRPISC